jgi:hypothetical protein
MNFEFFVEIYPLDKIHLSNGSLIRAILINSEDMSILAKFQDDNYQVLNMVPANRANPFVFSTLSNEPRYERLDPQTTTLLLLAFPAL